MTSPSLCSRFARFFRAVVLPALCLPLLAPAASSVGEIKALKVESGGAFTFDGLSFSLLHFAMGWERTPQTAAMPAPGHPREEGPAWLWQGSLLTRNETVPLALRQRIVASGDRAFEVGYEVEHPSGLPTREFALEIRLPAPETAGRPIVFDNDVRELPVRADGMAVVPGVRARTLRLPSMSGSLVIESDDPMRIRVEDMRAWKYPTFDYRVRIRFPSGADTLKSSSLRVRVRHEEGLEGDVPVPVVMKANEEWVPYVHSLEIEPGGVFDFSFLGDAPAGKHGPVVVTPAGHFEFADRPGKRVRLWGVNLCFSANFLEKEEADRLAARLAASGYNTVRFHHYDAGLVQKGGRSDSTFNPGNLDKLDYLFAAMKRHGLYINLDLFTVRSWHFSDAEKTEMGMSRSGDGVYEFKALVPISTAAMENWERFARTLLTHVNPYTGLTWAEDPALVGVCPVNEDVLQPDKIERHPTVRALYEKEFERWWGDKANQEKAGRHRATGYNRFLVEMHIRADRRMHTFLRSLGVRAPLTGVNFLNMQGLAFAREHYDVVDNHQYWAHPKGLPGAPGQPRRTGFGQGSAVRFEAEVPRGIMQSRLWGKPYTVTEFNFVSPNRYRAEGGVLMPAYASLQDWDALYNFEYASRRTYAMEGGTARNFSLTADPIGLLADRVSALLFLRGDIAPARGKIGFAIDEGSAFGPTGASPDVIERLGDMHIPEVFTKLGLVSRIGSGTRPPKAQRATHDLRAVVGGGKNADRGVYAANEKLIARLLSDGVLPAGSVDETRGRFKSDTGEIELHAGQGTLKVVTARSELFVLPENGSLRGSRVSVRNGEAFATVSVVSVDGKPLSQSERILVLHLTDALPAGTRFSLPDRTVLENWGEGPHLVRAGSTELTLQLDGGRTGYQAWAVDATGRRLREVAMKRYGSAWVLSANTVTPEGTQLAYEIVRR